MDQLPPPLKRDLIRRLIVGVKFGKDEMEVALNPSALLSEISENRAQKRNRRTEDAACIAMSPVRLLSKLGSQGPEQTKSPSRGLVLEDVFGHSLCKNIELNEEIPRLYTREKLSLKRIAARFNVSRDRVRTALSRAGIKIEGDTRTLVWTGQTPFGWKREKGRLAPHLAEQKIISRMAEARRSGLSLHAVARALTAEGVRTKNGGRWHAKSVSQILKCNARLLAERERQVRKGANLNL